MDQEGNIMGDEYEVSIWNADKGVCGAYIHRWGGDTLEEALEQMQKLKEEGYLCIKLEWRPQ